MFKSKTSDYFRKYRRPKQQKDDNSEKIMNIINDIGNFNDILLGFIGKEIEDKLSEDVNYDELITNQQIMDEVKWFVKNKLNWYDRELFTLYYDENLSHYEISKITKIPATSIGLTIRTIKKNLMNHLTNKKIFK